MIQTRRQWLQAAALWPACLALPAATKEFWQSKDPATWTGDEKQLLLGQSPWAREGFVRVELLKNRPQKPGYGNDGRPADHLTPVGPGIPPGGAISNPIGEEIPPVPDPDPNHPVQFRALARWETAKPVRLAGGPDLPDAPEFYVIRLRGLPLMPPPKPKPGESVPDPNQYLLVAIKNGSRLIRKDKPDIPCARLFTGSGNEATQVLLFFPRSPNAITIADKQVTLDSTFAQFHLAIKFPLADMMYKGELAL